MPKRPSEPLSAIEIIGAAINAPISYERGLELGAEIVSALDKGGFAIVPKEPVREMWAAGGNACVTLGNVHHDRITGDVWTAMVAAGAIKP